MRTLLIAGTALVSLVGADAAMAADRVVQRGPGGWAAPRPGPQVGQPRGPRWGSKVGGRWWGGVNAPGGWTAYRRPVRGWMLPAYWNTPRFYVTDWNGYGLAQPPQGHTWVRYYDDAVLIDGRGSVYDTVGGLDWDRYDGTFAGRDDRVAYGADYDVPPPPPIDRGPARRDSGAGGALAGAAVGGVAGTLIGGRGNRLGGALIGAGVGAAAGYAIDRAEDRGRRAPPPVAPDYGADYPPPAYGPYPQDYPPAPVGPGGHWTSPDGMTTVVTSGGGYYGGAVTTVTVQSAPVVTTTTTEIVEDHVTRSRPVVYRKAVRHRPARKVVCRCK